MIDDKELKHRQIMASIFGPHDEAEIIRHARRYLALREHGVIADLKPDAEWLFAGSLDKAADKLIQEMLK